MLGLARASVLALVPLLLFTSYAAADSYPDRPIRLIVPFAPGGGTDINARILQDPIGHALGQTIVIDNRPGAGSSLGSAMAARATPDGYTLLLGTISLTINPAVYRDLPFDAQRDLIPITRVSDQPSILVSRPALAAKNFKELAALIRASEGKLAFGSAGIGTGSHLATEMMLQRLGAQMLHVPFKGTGPALNALLAGEITMYQSTFASALPHVKQGRLRAYAVTTLKRAGPLPDVPTLDEEGITGYEYAAWYGLFAPTGTPQPILAKIHKAATNALALPRVLRMYADQGLNATPTTPEEFARYFASEKTKWAGVARSAHIAMQ